MNKPKSIIQIGIKAIIKSFVNCHVIKFIRFTCLKYIRGVVKKGHNVKNIDKLIQKVILTKKLEKICFFGKYIRQYSQNIIDTIINIKYALIGNKKSKQKYAITAYKENKTAS